MRPERGSEKGHQDPVLLLKWLLGKKQYHFNVTIQAKLSLATLCLNEYV